MAGFVDLIVWREAAALAAAMLRIAPQVRGTNAMAVRDQMIRAAESIPANIAEGYGRGVTRDCLRFLKMARSSAGELESHLRVASIGRRLPQHLAEPAIGHTCRVRFLIIRFAESVERRIAQRGHLVSPNPASLALHASPNSPSFPRMPLSSRFTVGSLVCHTLEAGLQRLDGGAMFGVVPKPLWERRIPADARNRIPLQMRCLLVEHPDGLVLIDTGSGNKDDAKFKDIYGIENAGDPGPTALEDAIRETGHQPADVTWVINTHLHFDHAGGDTVKHADGTIAPSFPGATYVVQKRELDFASTPNERIRASYLPANYQPVVEAGLFLLVMDEVQILPGIRALPTPGHVPYHQSILIQSGGETACFLGDIVPTTAHLPAPWIMGYDLEPLVTLATKKKLLTRAAHEGWTLIFEHDPVVGRGTVPPDAKKGWGPLSVDSAVGPV